MGLLICQESGDKNRSEGLRLDDPSETLQDIEHNSNTTIDKKCKRWHEKMNFKEGQDKDEEIEAVFPSNPTIKSEEHAATVMNVLYEDSEPENLKRYPTSDCNRCKRKFAQIGIKSFKMCEHCRTLQRQRSRRWKRRTKQKEGVCTRCGTDLLEDSTKFSLCQHCRDMLRSKKANRYLEGRCVHCSGPNDDDGVYKVCKRCRENDKLRRMTLEQEGLCNRCSSELPKDERGHKICQTCRTKKRKSVLQLGSEAPADERSIVRNIEVEQLFANALRNKEKLQNRISPVIEVGVESQSPFIKPKSFSGKRKLASGSNNQSVDKSQLLSQNEKADKSKGMKEIIDEEVNDKNGDFFSKKTYKNKGIASAEGKDDLDQLIQEEKKIVNNVVDFAHCTSTSAKNDSPIIQQPATIDDSEKNEKVIEVEGHSGGDCDEKDSIENDDLKRLEENVDEYHEHIISSNKTLQENIMLSQTFETPHDHSQLNRQLKQLSHFTSHSSNTNGDTGDEDDESVLVDLDGLEEIGMEYTLEDVENGAPTAGDGNTEYEEEKETMLRHVRAVQAGLLSSTTEPSDAELAAAVEAVAVAAAVARSRDDGK